MNNVKAFVAGTPEKAKPYVAPEHRWGSIIGPQENGMTVYQPNGKWFRVPRWAVQPILIDVITKGVIYGGIRRPSADEGLPADSTALSPSCAAAAGASVAEWRWRWRQRAHDLALVSRSEHELTAGGADEIAQQGGHALAMPADLTDPSSAALAVRAADRPTNPKGWLTCCGPLYRVSHLSGRQACGDQGPSRRRRG